MFIEMAPGDYITISPHRLIRVNTSSFYGILRGKKESSEQNPQTDLGQRFMH